MALTKMDTKTGVTSETMIMDDELENYVSKFSEKSIGMLTQRMTKMYSNPIEAAVRETISNAIDATLLLPEAERKPIEVISPTDLDTNFIVQDHGVGMTTDDVKNHFTQYGSSTKENNLNVIGAYGLGAKAPLAYASSFTVDTVKDGVKTQFMMSRDNELIKTTVLGVTETSEPNGTKVMIPVEYEDVQHFVAAVSPYSTFSIDVPILINGEGPVFDNDWTCFDTLVLDDDSGTTGRLYYRNDDVFEVAGTIMYNYDSSIVGVLDGMPYDLVHYYNVPANSESYNTYNLVLELKPGVVNFSTSRENIIDDYKAQNLENAIKDKFNPSKSSQRFKLLCNIFSTFDDAKALLIWNKLLGTWNSSSEVNLAVKKTHPKVYDKLLNIDEQPTADALIGVRFDEDYGYYFYSLLGVNKLVSNRSQVFYQVGDVRRWYELSSFQFAFGDVDKHLIPHQTVYSSPNWIKYKEFHRKNVLVASNNMSCPFSTELIEHDPEKTVLIAITGVNKNSIYTLVPDYFDYLTSSRTGRPGLVLFSIFYGEPSPEQRKALDDYGYDIMTVNEAKRKMCAHADSDSNSEDSKSPVLRFRSYEADDADSIVTRMASSARNGLVLTPGVCQYMVANGLRNDDVVIISNNDNGESPDMLLLILSSLRNINKRRVLMLNYHDDFTEADIEPYVNNGNDIVLFNNDTSYYTSKFDWSVFRNADNVHYYDFRRDAETGAELDESQQSDMNRVIIDNYYKSNAETIAGNLLRILSEYDSEPFGFGHHDSCFYSECFHYNILNLAANDVMKKHKIIRCNTPEENIINNMHYIDRNASMCLSEKMKSKVIRGAINDEAIKFLDMFCYNPSRQLTLNEKLFVNSAMTSVYDKFCFMDNHTPDESIDPMDFFHKFNDLSSSDKEKCEDTARKSDVYKKIISNLEFLF